MKDLPPVRLAPELDSESNSSSVWNVRDRCFYAEDFDSIQDAIDNADVGLTILVCPGTYFENIDFLGKAIAVRSVIGPEKTIIDGSQSGRVVTFKSG